MPLAEMYKCQEARNVKDMAIDKAMRNTNKMLVCMVLSPNTLLRRVNAGKDKKHSYTHPMTRDTIKNTKFL